MEHRLLLGGTKYLSFARGRVKALRDSGAQYVTERYIFPDAVVRVSIIGGVEYIVTTPGACGLYLDSGVVDIFATTGSNRYKAGVLLETDASRAYQAQYVLGDNGWKTKPTPGNQITGQLSVLGTDIKGRVLPDESTAASFKPEQKVKTQPWPHPTDPPTYETNETDEILVQKKALVTYCPASIFTGKCRLWVQAMYGVPLHVTTGQAASLPRIPSIITASTPSIDVRPIGGNKDADLPDVRITTNCGVWLDKTTGRHWMFSPNADGSTVTIYPLVSDLCGNQLRAFLVTEPEPKIKDHTLTATDLEHLETYVLSSARPDHLNRVVVSMGRSVSAWSCGYGWHWNWDGDTADIVVNDMVSSGYDGTMESTHYRMKVTKTVVISNVDGSKSDVWSIQTSVVEGPTRWAVLRAWFPIAFPEWLSGTLQKLTPHDSVEVSCEAPFYAFYVRNTLKVCRYKCVPTNLPANRDMSLDYALNKAYGTTVDHLTLGERGGFLNDDGETGMHNVSTFKIGSYETRQLPRWRTRAAARYKTFGVTDMGGFGGGTFGSPGAYTLTQGYGYPAIETYSGSGWPTRSTSGVVVTPYDNGVGQFEYWHLRHTYTEQKSSEADVVIPFYDSEAAFVRSSTVTRGTARSFQQWKLATWSGVGVAEFASGGSWYPGPYSVWGWNTAGVWTLNKRYVYWVPTIQANLILDYSSSGADAELQSEIEQVLVSHAGVSPATVPTRSTQLLHDNDCEEVEDKFPTWSGTGEGSNAIVLSPYLDKRGEVGFPDDNSVNLPVVVGWV